MATMRDSGVGAAKAFPTPHKAQWGKMKVTKVAPAKKRAPAVRAVTRGITTGTTPKAKAKPKAVAVPKVGVGTASAPAPAIDYMAIARQMYAPLRQQTEQDLRNRFANQGILSSTAAGGEMAKAQTAIGADEAKFAEEGRRYDLSRSDTMAQQLIQNALNLYNTQYAGALGRAAYDTSVRYPSEPQMFGGIFNQPYLAPQRSAFGPKGDATIDRSRGEATPHFTWDAGGRQRQTQAFEAAQNAAARGLQKRSLDLEERRLEADIGKTDDVDWDSALTALQGNYRLGLESPGKNMTPTQMLKTIEADFLTPKGLDLETEIRRGNQSAIGAVYATYKPEVARRVIERVKGGWNFGDAIEEADAEEATTAAKPNDRTGGYWNWSVPDKQEWDKQGAFRHLGSGTVDLVENIGKFGSGIGKWLIK